MHWSTWLFRHQFGKGLHFFYGVGSEIGKIRPKLVDQAVALMLRPKTNLNEDLFHMTNLRDCFLLLLCIDDFVADLFFFVFRHARRVLVCLGAASLLLLLETDQVSLFLDPG